MVIVADLPGEIKAACTHKPVCGVNDETYGHLCLGRLRCSLLQKMISCVLGFLYLASSFSFSFIRGSFIDQGNLWLVMQALKEGILIEVISVNQQKIKSLSKN